MLVRLSIWASYATDWYNLTVIHASYNITLNAAQVCGKSHKSAHFLKEAPGSSARSLIRDTAPSDSTNMQRVHVQGKISRAALPLPQRHLHCPTDFMSRPESLAALPHTLDMHPLLASGKRYWLLQSATTRLTASFPRLLEPSLHAHLHLPTHSSQELTLNWFPTHTHTPTTT